MGGRKGGKWNCKWSNKRRTEVFISPHLVWVSQLYTSWKNLYLSKLEQIRNSSLSQHKEGRGNICKLQPTYVTKRFQHRSPFYPVIVSVLVRLWLTTTAQGAEPHQESCSSDVSLSCCSIGSSPCAKSSSSSSKDTWWQQCHGLLTHAWETSSGRVSWYQTDSACLHQALAPLQTQSPSPTQRQENTVTAEENVSSLYKVTRVPKGPFPITKLIFCYSSSVGIFISSNAKGDHTVGYCPWIPIVMLHTRLMAMGRGVSTQLPKIQPLQIFKLPL